MKVRYCIFFIFTLLLLISIGCAESDSTEDEDSDGNASNGAIYVTVVAVDPAEDTTTVSVGSPISVAFSSKMDRSTLTTNTADDACSGSIQVSGNDFSTCVGFFNPMASAGDTRFTVTPKSDLDYNTRYTIFRAAVQTKNHPGAFTGAKAGVIKTKSRQRNHFRENAYSLLLPQRDRFRIHPLHSHW